MVCRSGSGTSTLTGCPIASNTLTSNGANFFGPVSTISALNGLCSSGPSVNGAFNQITCASALGTQGATVNVTVATNGGTAPIGNTVKFITGPPTVSSISWPVCSGNSPILTS